MLTTEQLLKIDQDAKAATPGPWQVQTSCSYRRIGRTHRGDGDVVCGSLQPFDGHPDLSATMPTLEHIANCDPQTVMELVKMARRYQYVREHMFVLDDTDIHRHYDPSYYQNGEALDAAVEAGINSQRKEGGEE